MQHILRSVFLPNLISQVIQLNNELNDSIQIEMANIHPCCELAAKSVPNLEILCSFGLLCSQFATDGDVYYFL